MEKRRPRSRGRVDLDVRTDRATEVLLSPREPAWPDESWRGASFTGSVTGSCRACQILRGQSHIAPGLQGYASEAMGIPAGFTGGAASGGSLRSRTSQPNYRSVLK